MNLIRNRSFTAALLYWVGLVLALNFSQPLKASASTNAPIVRVSGLCKFILHDYQLSKSSEASVNMVVKDLLKKLQNSFEFTTTTNPTICIRVFGAFEDFRDFAQKSRGPRDGEHAGVVMSNLAGYYSLNTREVVMWQQKDRMFFGNSLLHECSHAIMHDKFRHVPIWLDEGCAVHFAFPPYMQDPSDRQMLISHRLLMNRYLSRDKLPELRAFLNMSDNEFRGMPSESSYQVSWSLFEFLITTPQRRKAMNQMLKRIQATDMTHADCARLLDEAYPGGLVRMEKDWRDWIIRSAGTVRDWRLIEKQE